jgi:hypothetical protein
LVRGGVSARRSEVVRCSDQLLVTTQVNTLMIDMAVVYAARREPIRVVGKE